MLNKLLIITLCLVGTLSFSPSHALVFGLSQSQNDDPDRALPGASGYVVALIGAGVVVGALTAPVSAPIYTLVVGVVADADIESVDSVAYSVSEDTATSVEVGIMSSSERSIILTDVDRLQNSGQAFVFSPERFVTYVNEAGYTRDEAFQAIALESLVSKELVAYLASKSGIQ